MLFIVHPVVLGKGRGLFDGIDQRLTLDLSQVKSTESGRIIVCYQVISDASTRADQRFRLAPGESVLGPRRVPHAFVYDGAGPGRMLIGFTPAVRIEQFFRDLEKRGEYFGNGTPVDKELVHRLYGIVNVGPPLKL